jgi:hypothetical protein
MRWLSDVVLTEHVVVPAVRFQAVQGTFTGILGLWKSREALYALHSSVLVHLREALC